MVSKTKKFVGFFLAGYRGKFTKEYDVYDEEGKEGGMLGKCIFCNIAMKDENWRRELWYEDEHVVVFEDHKPRAKLHGLCIPKRHIRDIDHLKESDLDLLRHMHEVSLKVLE